MTWSKHVSWIISTALLCALRTNGEPALADFWYGRASWSLDAQHIGSEFGFHFLSIWADQQHDLRAYCIQNHVGLDGKIKSAVGLAHGTDGLHWTSDGIVLDVDVSTWDDRLASFPGIWKDGKTWYLVYEGAAEDIKHSPGDIGLATSADGRHFVKHGEPILRHEPTGWEQTNIGTPSLYKEDGIWYLFYHGFDHHVVQIGVASGKDLLHLAKSPSNPIVPVSPDPAAWDCGTVGKRSEIMKEGPYYFFAFEGSMAQPFDRAKWSSGLARTRNLTAKWELCPRNPIIPPTPGGMGNDGPELLRLDGSWYLYVRSPKGNFSDRYRLQADAER